jgi:hypothetical protein
VTAIASWVGADNLYQRLADRLVELISGFNPRAKRSGALDRVEVNDRPRKFLFDEMD